MSTPRPAPRAADGSEAGPRFVLYVEGARDHGLVESWARAKSPPLARSVAAATVILGGCRPARAAEHFRERRAEDPGARALCVLDRDLDEPRRPLHADEPGLEFFTWQRRHIESYLLVPEAVRRALRLPPSDSRVERFFRSELPHPEDEAALAGVDAKRLFGPNGDLARLFGRAVMPGRIARVMLASELHPEIHDLIRRLREALGTPEPQTSPRNS